MELTADQNMLKIADIAIETLYYHMNTNLLA